ncbi:MAG: UvrD-helicase domain-containing protein, partial [Verrucomicrobiae bacterium]|nr:UvrD-helicase domain-containing protein [Verrucomicrobiae bacterium]
MAARFILQRFVLTTFTRKAAAEMQTRLFGALNEIARAHDFNALPEIARPVVPEKLLNAHDFPALRAGAEALAELATELQVSTLHSFAARLLRRHPAAAGIGPDVILAEEEETPFRDLFPQLIHRWWEHVCANPPLQTKLAQLLEHLTVANIQTWLESVHAHPWLVDQLNLPRPQSHAVADAIRHLNALANVAISQGDKIQESQRVLRALLTEYEAGQPSALGQLCSKLPSILDPLCKSKQMQKALGQTLEKAWVAQNIEQPLVRELLHTDLAITWQTWREFLREFVGWSHDALVRELGVVTYDELIRRAVRLLRDHPEIRRTEHDRLWAILVDEFQDTDPAQLELLELLLRRDHENDPVVHGFFVGDRKQSIYRFRQVDLPAIEAFHGRYLDIVRASSAEVIEVHLTTSFRSGPTILQHVNEDFLTRFGETYPYADEALQPRPNTTASTSLVEVNRISRPPDMKARPFREAVAHYIATFIRDYLSESSDHRLTDVLVLVRNHNELSAMIAALEKGKIPVVSAGSLTFQRYPEVLDTLNLLIALHHPGDSLAVGAVLHLSLIHI